MLKYLIFIIIFVFYILKIEADNHEHHFIEKSIENSYNSNDLNDDIFMVTRFVDGSFEHENDTFYYLHNSNSWSKQEKGLKNINDKISHEISGNYSIYEFKKNNNNNNNKKNDNFLIPYSYGMRDGLVYLYFEKELQREFYFYCCETNQDYFQTSNSKIVVLNLEKYSIHHNYISILISSSNSHHSILIKTNQKADNNNNYNYNNNNNNYNYNNYNEIIEIIWIIFFLFCLYQINKLIYKSLYKDYIHKNLKSSRLIEENIEKKDIKKKIKKLNNYYSITIIITLLLCFFTHHTYDYGNGTLTTSFFGEYVFNLPSQSWEGCYKLLDESKQSLSTLRFKVTDYHFQTEKEFLYSTSCFESIISQKIQCDGVGTCGDGVCSSIKPSDPTCEGELRGVATKYIGVSGCVSPYKNIQVGCYLWPEDTICGYYRVGLIPKGPFYNVYEITKVIVKYNVQAFLDDKPLSIGMNDDFQIKYSFDGSFVPDMTLKGRKLIQLGDDYYDLSGAAERGGGSPSQFGDFQGTSITALQNSVFSNIRYAQGIISNIRPVRDSKKVTFKADITQPGCNVLPKGGVKYPTRIGDLTYSVDKDGVLYGYPSIHNPITIYMTIPGKNNITFTKVIKEVCPVSRNVIVKESCRNCLSEASITIELMSKCNKRNIIITNKNQNVSLITHTLSITNSFNQFTIYYSSQLEDVEDTFCFNNISCINFKAKLLNTEIFLLTNNISSSNSEYKGIDKDYNTLDFSLTNILKTIVSLPLKLWSLILNSLGINPYLFITIGILILIGCSSSHW
ncbi:hypothetical protein ACTFIR_003868 [Dictyostelium discoideum]